MIVSTDPADMLRGDVYEVRVRGSQYNGLQVTDFCDPTSAAAARMSATQRPVILNDADVVVPDFFNGLTIENYGLGTGTSSHPVDMGLVTHWHRCLGQGSYWPQIETSAGVYDFSRLRAALVGAKAKGCKTLWNMAYTPAFHAANTALHRSSGSSTAGWPSAPSDLAASMQANPANNSAIIAAFVTAAMNEVGDLLDAVVWWNEPGYCYFNGTNAPFGNWYDTSNTGDCHDWTTVRSSVTGDQLFTQFVLCQACAYTVVKALRPSIVFIGCDLYGEQSSQSAGGKQAGTYSFGKWLDAGGATYCDAYGWHSYCDLYQLAGLDGVSKRLVGLLKGLETQRIASGAPAKPWYCTEVGFNNMGALSPADQALWAARNLLIHASLGFQACIGYAWDSLNPATVQMSWNIDAGAPYFGSGLRPGLQPVARPWSDWGTILAGSTISAGAVQLSDGRWCGKIGGLPYVV